MESLVPDYKVELLKSAVSTLRTATPAEFFKAAFESQSKGFEQERTSDVRTGLNFGRHHLKSRSRYNGATRFNAGRTALYASLQSLPDLIGSPFGPSMWRTLTCRWCLISQPEQPSRRLLLRGRRFGLQYPNLWQAPRGPG